MPGDTQRELAQRAHPWPERLPAPERPVSAANKSGVWSAANKSRRI